MIVINKKPNITHLPYRSKKRSGVFSFRPGQNDITPDVWQAVQAEAGKRMAYYGSFLKPVGEPEDSEKIDIGKLSAQEAVDLAGATMTVDLLQGYAAAENARKAGPRKSVLDAIEKQTADIQEIEDKKAKKASK